MKEKPIPSRPFLINHLSVLNHVVDGSDSHNAHIYERLKNVYAKREWKRTIVTVIKSKM